MSVKDEMSVRLEQIFRVYNKSRIQRLEGSSERNSSSMQQILESLIVETFP